MEPEAESHEFEPSPRHSREPRAVVLLGVPFVVRDRIEANDAEGAKTTVALAIAAIEDPAARSQFERIQSALASGARIALRDDAGSPAESESEDVAGKFNEAVELANAGRTDEGLAKLEAIITACSDNEACERAKQAASQLRPVVRHNRWVKQFNDGVELTNGGKVEEARVIFQKLEKEIDDPKLLAEVRRLLGLLGAKPAR